MSVEEPSHVFRWQLLIAAPTIKEINQKILRGLSNFATKSILNISYDSIHNLFVCAINSIFVRTFSATNVFRSLSIVFPMDLSFVNLSKFSSTLLAEAFRSV